MTAQRPYSPVFFRSVPVVHRGPLGLDVTVSTSSDAIQLQANAPENVFSINTSAVCFVGGFGHISPFLQKGMINKMCC